MATITSASNTQKTIILTLHERWTLRYVDHAGWCLFMPGWERPFAHVKNRSVKAMTEAGWLTVGTAPIGLGCRLTKELTPLGEKYAKRLIRKNWMGGSDWNPYDIRNHQEAGEPTDKSRRAA